jgi:hypothetical protein
VKLRCPSQVNGLKREGANYTEKLNELRLRKVWATVVG